MSLFSPLFFIISSTKPTTHSLSLCFLDLIECMENEERITPTWLFILVHNIIPFPFRNITHLFKWCSKVMCCKVKSKHFICFWKGLLLFCHKEGQADGNLTYGSYHYYVINLVTKQCVAVLLPEPCTTPYSFVTLWYEPSWHKADLGSSRIKPWWKMRKLIKERMENKVVNFVGLNKVVLGNEWMGW